MMVDSWLENNEDEIHKKMKNADFMNMKEGDKLDNYQQKKMIKEHLLQEAEKLSK